ncbi:MAG: DUF2330 domain-containing protein [Armatimonadetes bacterium]|nr:DUF2330 domain-containing protein [Armatimonadota bacterium]
MKENIDVYDAGQKAIIAWKDGDELLILSTDKYTSQKAKVLEFMPLPSKPDVVEKSSEEVFWQVAALIERHRPRVHGEDAVRRDVRTPPAKSSGPAAEPAVQVVFHEKIGAHDITIGQVKRMDGFTDWVKKFYTKNEMQYREDDVKKLRPMVTDYLNRGYQYFVFDIIELGTEKKSIEPIMYRFKSKNLYFPLAVTTLAEGETTVALYLFTPGKTDIWGTKTGFVSGFYTLNGRVSYENPIKFPVNRNEVQQISPILRDFLGAADRRWFSTAKYQGPTKRLTRDFILRIAPEAAGIPSTVTF